METIETKLDKRYVQKRISDWKMRVSKLFSLIKEWLKNSEYNLKPGAKLMMYEELMSQFDIPAVEIDTVDIYKQKDFILTIKPKGLWMIGANGRIDILTTKANYTLIDTSEQFETPKWKLFNGNKLIGMDFDKQTFLRLLK